VDAPAFARYRRDATFTVLRQQGRFVLAMALGSVAGAAAGGLLVDVVPTAVLVPVLVGLLLLSAARVWRH
jgi:uncharacterized membrane protein YfcA